MSYSFDIVGVTPILDFFYYQQQVEKNPNRSKAYLGSYQCSLDGFIKSIQVIPEKPQWNWDEVIESIIDFWLHQEETIETWKQTLENSHPQNLIIARVANVKWLRQEFQSLL
ncbi:MAG: hypothetical protein GW795_12505 [Cyanobacteria bacterium]|nr:hypothetical protein [Cyanobacteria bacterium CG_2015-16_32_12]NCO79586.1 hypothetical protein [Cyanobacteria bacterium CG_2015-22_32_23]NCQ03539.1 hypothetical protein [Cyanobacteria bacterium CG_2015-09_32_10]NCQ42665.1 hypothetical protein [Cyanobacteria bacterium CG_2015-04_32_10]NCS85511.1 hypothetical protein [Cyanobacteria bacterium CG_2015-02_32_10]